jgi:hypothetical protein
MALQEQVRPNICTILHGRLRQNSPPSCYLWSRAELDAPCVDVLQTVF